MKMAEPISRSLNLFDAILPGSLAVEDWYRTPGNWPRNEMVALHAVMQLLSHLQIASLFQAT